MLRPIDISIDNAVAFSAADKIVLEDIDVAINVISNKLRDYDELSLYIEVESFKGIALGALMRDIKFAIPNYNRFTKKAVVTNKPWLQKVISVSNKLFPRIEIRHFDSHQKFQAKTWLTGELAS
ncbi:MAG: STAS/SEC14 domain-containing protein [Gammaproteobacteria bacterium]|nr:STAS/SEC14 domain-containing protein [Gammaproteobacteria bacterium]PCH64473.1 MAG: STAS/SEC14 domain-containing protein [Gammaproteobacteria bacterium]